LKHRASERRADAWPPGPFPTRYWRPHRGFPPRLFLAPTGNVEPTALHSAVATALGNGGTLLDVACGGGAASLPPAAKATHLSGVDCSAATLANFAAAAERAATPHREILGTWPEAANLTPCADVVVCRHVVYNVSDIAAFIGALAERARRRVVVELSESHPSTALAPLWQRFWGLDRPGEPTADLFVEVVRELGFHPRVQHDQRPVAKLAAGGVEYVAFVRRRLCVGPERDP
jgi:hypothetical protein